MALETLFLYSWFDDPRDWKAIDYGFKLHDLIR